MTLVCGYKVFIMSVRKTKKEFQEGMQKLGDMFDSLMERHMGKISIKQLGVVAY